MASSWVTKKRNSAANLVLPETEVSRRVSLTGYSNVVLDESTNSIKRSSATNLVIPETENSRRVSLTGYSNVILDESKNSNINDEVNNKLRVRFANLPSMSLDFSEDVSIKRKYSVAMQVLKPFRPSSKDGKLPVNRVGFFSYVFVTWFSSLAWKMFKNRTEPVSESDVWECSTEEGVRLNTERLLRLWTDEVNNKGSKKASFERVWKKFIWTRVVVALMVISLMALSTFLSSALLVNLLLAYLESGEDNLGYGLTLVAGVFGAELTRACSFSVFMIFASQTGTRFRSAFIGIMYDKLLKMKTMKGKTSSEIINVFSVDSYRVYVASLMVPVLLVMPVYLIIGTVYCYTLIGYWCFVSIGTFVVCYTIQMSLTRLLQTLRRPCAQLTDSRVRFMSEILNSMKFIKMYAWEQPFNEAVKNVRQSEQKYLLYSALVNAITGSIIPVTPTIASVVTITIYTAVGNDLKASTAFAVIGTMNFLRAIVSFIPFAMRALGEAKVSFNRIRNLLLLEEFEEPSTECFDQENVVEIKAANFVWDLPLEVSDNTSKKEKENKMKRKSSVVSLTSRRESISLFAMTDVDFEVKYGTLLGICGSVGAGKSSLMSVILGRMTMIKGHLAVRGDVAYVAQQAWIFNASLKENILFGREYEPQRYRTVLEACGLEPDINILVDGDETEIGERGANLSGGQKQRVNLARAVYSDSDIYILDDPLSAVDVRVGMHLFHSCIKGILKEKTVLLVTHQLQYLKHCDDVVVMDDGSIVERGRHDELLANDGLYSDMFKIFDTTTIKATKKESNDADNDVKDITQVVSYIKNKVGNTSNEAHANTTATNGNAKKKKKKKSKLVLSEESSVGSVSFSTYLSYMNAAGGVSVAFIVILMYAIAAGSIVFSDFWLSLWIDSITGKLQINTTAYNMSSTAIPYPETTENTSYTTVPVSYANTTLPTVLQSSGLSSDTYFLVYILSLAGILILQLAKGFAGAKASIKASNRLHARCLDKVMKAPMSFFDSNPVGRILNRFSKDLDEGDVFIPQCTNAFLQMFTLSVLSIAMAAYVTPWLLIALVPVLGVFYLMKSIANVSVRQLKRLENITRSPLISHVNVTSQGLPTIVAYKQQGRFYDKCIGMGDVASVAIFLFEVSMRWIGLRLDLVAGMMTVSVGLIFVLTRGLVSPAAAGLVLGLCGKTVSIVQFLVRLMNETEARFTSIERLHEYEENLASEPQHAKKMASEKWPAQGGIIFRNVVMSYRPEMDPVLKGVSFEIHPREKVGVVGRTGAGKSSLAAVLFRLVELSGGQVIVDDEDISQLHLNVVRNRISTIPQEPVLFNGTLRYNIDPFNLYSDDDIWIALEKVHMKEKIVQFDEGLEVFLEENGDNFSVGERQLICLARAVLRSCKILLLDEATANIDTTTDSLIQETIRACFADCTVITIAHRLNTVLHSDRIIVMDSGQVMECASPQDLLSNPNSFFNSMIAAQSVKTPL